MALDRIRSVWYHMWNRCYSPINDRYESYGGRGIRVCDEWRNLEIFRRWALANGYESHLTIERKDVNGHYTPDNCEWATEQKQNQNRTTTKLTLAKARAIREDYSNCSMDLKEFAKLKASVNKVSTSTIRDIVLNRKWKES